MWGNKPKVVRSYRMPREMVLAMDRARYSATDIVIAAVDEWLQTYEPQIYNKAKLETDSEKTD